MSEKYKVVGPCEVAGVAPGNVVTREVLEEHGARIEALIQGKHLEQVRTQAKPATGSGAEKGK